MDFNDKLHEWKAKLEQAKEYGMFVDSEAVAEMIQTIERQTKTLKFVNKVCVEVIEEQRKLQQENSDKFNAELLNFAWGTNDCISDM